MGVFFFKSWEEYDRRRRRRCRRTSIDALWKVGGGKDDLAGEDEDADRPPLMLYGRLGGAAKMTLPEKIEMPTDFH
ncbi:hypothetical protein TIFTF001_001249 [Ficus carica]|uniref:Uncharacterized protein n=1 Tax=Ficus carica TaxID=3494 RepID=A0AA87ZLC3_FICCA|nr:hypothetical protein TIFTF001_001249 [Ficus carica]